MFQTEAVGTFRRNHVDFYSNIILKVGSAHGQARGLPPINEHFIQLEGITEYRAFTLLLRSQFGMALINEITKAWYYPEYWAYVSICREMDMEPKPPASEGIYDRTHIAEYIRRADYEYGLRDRTRKKQKTHTF